MSSLNAIYLDHNASSPLRPQVRETMEAAFDLIGNPASVHQFGKAAKVAIEGARREIGHYLQVHPDTLIFTSGGTESNNMVLKDPRWCTILVSATEHDSVDKASTHRQHVRVDSNGHVDKLALAEALQKADHPCLVSIAVANNETGVLAALPEIAALVHQHGAFLHTDAVQTLGRMAFSPSQIPVDFASFSFHKMGGPFGIGLLYVRAGLELTPLLNGGGQELRRRSGTLNTSAILGAASALTACDLASETAMMIQHQKRVEEFFLQDVAPHYPVCLFGCDVPRLPNTTSVSILGFKGATQLMNLDLKGIAVSSGAACTSGSMKPTRTLLAMGASEEQAECAIRISTGWNTKEDDITTFIKTWRTLYLEKESRVS